MRFKLNEMRYSKYSIYSRSYTIAFIVPIKESLLSLAKKLVKNIDSYSYEDICNDPGLVKEVQRILAHHGKNNGLEKFEIPIKIQLDRKSTRLNSSHSQQSRMPSSA